MITKTRNIKCLKCNVFTTDADYCKVCGTLISHEKKVILKEQNFKEDLDDVEKWRLEHPNWVERLKKHPSLVYRVVGHLLYSVIFIVSAIGSLLAWSIAMIAAG